VEKTILTLCYKQQRTLDKTTYIRDWTSSNQNQADGEKNQFQLLVARFDLVSHLKKQQRRPEEGRIEQTQDFVLPWYKRNCFDDCAQREREQGFGCSNVCK
jgi:hypothetical protein